VRIQAQDTTANPIYIHGHGASISFAPTQEGNLFLVATGARIRNLELFAPGGNAMSLQGIDPIIAEGIKTHFGYYGIATSGNVTLRNIRVDDGTYGISFSGQLTIDGAVIRGGETAIQLAATTGVANISNVLAYGTSQRGVDLPNATGSVSFTTVVDTGGSVTSGPRGIACSPQLTIRSTIIWTPGSGTLPPIEGCNLASTIAGPQTAPGAMNVDPKFVNAAMQDYHLLSSSPAVDAVDSGPAADFEGDARPQGTRFDIGADEVK
jgi:hypothetical protein